MVRLWRNGIDLEAGLIHVWRCAYSSQRIPVEWSFLQSRGSFSDVSPRWCTLCLCASECCRCIRTEYQKILKMMERRGNVQILTRWMRILHKNYSPRSEALQVDIGRGCTNFVNLRAKLQYNDGSLKSW